MLGIHESRGAALLLSFSHRVQCERRLARAFRPVDLDDAAARETADAQGDNEPKRAGRNGLDLDRLARAEAHGRALAEGAVDLRQRGSRSEEHTSELQSLMRSSYAGCCLKKKRSTDEEDKTEVG